MPLKGFSLALTTIVSLLFAISCAHINIPILTYPKKEDIAVSKEYYKKSLISEKQGDIYNSLLYLQFALARDPINKVILSKYNSIIDTLSSEITGTQEIIKMGTGIINPIIFKIYRNFENKKIPVQGMPIHFKLINASGKITEKGITNDIGEAKCFIDKIDNYSENITIKAYIIIPDDKNGNEIKSLTKSFIFKNRSVLDLNIKILSKLNSTFRNNVTTIDLDKISEYIDQLFKDEGFNKVTIMPSFNISLFDKATNIDKLAIKNLGKESSANILFLISVNEPLNLQQSFDFYLKKVSIKIIIADSANGKFYINRTVNGKGAGKTEDNAMDTAIKNALSKMSEILKYYLGEVRIKNEFFKFSIKGKPITVSS